MGDLEACIRGLMSIRTGVRTFNPKSARFGEYLSMGQPEFIDSSAHKKPLEAFIQG